MKRTIVRCSSGGFFSTIWIPLVSLKAVRLGTSRYQRCPVHHRWEKVSRVDESALTADETATALATKDIGIP